MVRLVWKIKTDNFKSSVLSRWAILMFVALGTHLALVHGAIGISWKVISNTGEAMSLRRNSHSTATAWLVKYHGLNKPHETDKKLVATCWVYTQRCECGKPDKPTVWDIAEGLKKLCIARGHPNTPIKERCRHSSKSSETASWNDYIAAINDNRPVILTFCYAPTARQGLAQAKRRVEKCFSVAGIGYMKYGNQKLLICHDGITSDESYPASGDKVSASSLGINTEGKPWGQSGTSLYKWEGSYDNLVMVFVGRPTR